MALSLSRLLQHKSSLPICIKRFSTRKVGFRSSFCSSTDSDRAPRVNNDAAAEENREMTVEPLVNESAQAKPGILSNASSTGEERGTPWYMTVSHILKVKRQCNNQTENYYAIDASTPADSTASVVIPSSEAPVHESGKFQDSEATIKVQNDEIFNDKVVNVRHGKYCVAGEVYDQEVDGTASEINQMLSFPQAAETEDNDAFKTKRMCMSPGVSSLSNGENFCEEAARSNSELVAEESEFFKSDEVSSPIFSDLEVDLFLNPENPSAVQAPAISLNSTKCVKMKKNEMIIGDISVNLGFERGKLSAVFDGSKKTTSLVDLFLQKNHDRTSPEANIEKTGPEEALSDLKFERKRVSQLKLSSPIDHLLPAAATSDSEDDHFKEIPQIRSEKNLQEGKKSRFIVDQTSSSKGTQNIFDLKDLDIKSVNDQILDENFKPRSLTFTQSDEQSNEPSEVDAETLSDIKDLIDFIKLHEGVPSTSTNDNSDTGRTTDNPSTSNSQGFIYNDWSTASDLTTGNSSPENQKTSDVHFQSLGGTKLKASFEFKNPELKIDEENLRNSVLSESSNSNSKNLLDSERYDSSDFTTVESRIEDEESRIEDEERVDLDFGSLGCTELKAGPTKNVDKEKMEDTFLFSKESNHNKVVVRFLRKAATEEHIIETFKRCGTISKIEIIDVEGPLFKTAHIHFETRKGLQSAINESDMLVRHGVVTVESATSNKYLTVPVPNLIGDPNVPAVLIKNPSRTVKIKHLTRDIRLHHIEEALSFCESNVSRYFLGSTNSVGFIEFETEVGKERALVKHSINVLGKQLALLRIDSPRTTVVRVLHIDSIPLRNIMPICSSFGKVRFSLTRCPGILDVHYKFAEWPNMWNILNRLNGVEIEGMRLRAEPAPVFPPDVLLTLWHQPNKRKCLKNTALALWEKLGKNMLGTAELDSLEQLLED